MLKIKDVINKFKTIADIHPNINYFGVGSISGLTDDILYYPYLWLDTTLSHTINYVEDNGYKSIELEFVLRVGDKVNDNQLVGDIRGLGTTNEIDIISDTFSIILDIINTISEDSLGLFQEVILIDNVSVEPFYNEDAGDVTGNQATIILKIKNDKICLTPLND